MTALDAYIADAQTAAPAYTPAHAPGCPPGDTCPRCLAADMDAFLAAQGRDAARFSDGRNGEDTPEPRPRGTGGAARLTRPTETATDAQLWKIRHERDRRDTSRVQLPADADLEKMSKRAASTLIDKLLACPLAPADRPRRAYAPRMATDGQRAYVRSLLDERVHADPVDVDALTFADASALLDVLLCAPRKSDTVDLPNGPYRRDGVIYRISRHPRTGRVRCQRATVITDATYDQAGTLVTPAVVRFRSAPTMARVLTPADRLSAEEICDFGLSHGVCIFGHLLTDPISVAAGIGPVCAEKLGIDRHEIAAAKGVAVPARRTRKSPPPAPAEPVVNTSTAPADGVDQAETPAPATVPFVSSWGEL